MSRTRAAHVVVLSGGTSTERAISLTSGAAVLAALRENGDGRGPRRVEAIEIELGGAWRIGGEASAPEEALARIPRDAVTFIALHGGAGEDGTIQGLLAACDRAHTGSGVAASALCLCKSSARAVLAQAGLSVARARLVEVREWRAERARVESDVRAFGAAGVVVKPDHGGSSVATNVLDDLAGPGDAIAGLGDALDAVFASGDRALVEARVHGVECSVGVLDDERGAPRALTPIEIVPAEGRFFDHQQKYSADGARELCPPGSLAERTVARLRELGLLAHRSTGCRDLSRTDFMVPRASDGAFGEPVVLEVNTLPGMTPRSLLPLAAAEAGLSLRDVCLRLVERAVARAEQRP